VIRKLCLIGLGALLASTASSQVWEKPIAPGLTYRMEFDIAYPRIVHALRLNLKSRQIWARAELADTHIYKENESKGRGTVSQMAERTQAIASINGDFFPFTGDPLGPMVRDGELLSTPAMARSAIGWGPTTSGVGILEFQGSATATGKTTIPIAGVNQDAAEGEVVLNGPIAGFSRSRAAGTHVILKVEDTTLRPERLLKATVLAVITETSTKPIEPGTMTLAAYGLASEPLRLLSIGDELEIKLAVKGFDWTAITQTIGGGPGLVRNGQALVDWQAQKFQPTFANGRHPRTAVGRTSDGDLWMVVVDGRQKMSVGATLDEMAALMLRLGCVDAINLDGGGSSTLNVMGVVLNRPSDGKERPVANGIVVLPAQPVEATQEPLALKLPTKMAQNASAPLHVLDGNVRTIPHAQILWAASGGAWIDQGGQLRSFAPGVVQITAWVRGRRLTGTVTVEAPIPAQRSTKDRQGRKRLAQNNFAIAP
jgi:hypothetical protein